MAYRLSFSTILKRVNRITLALFLGLFIATGAMRSQETAPSVPPKAAVNDIFSGTVTELTAESVTVTRTALVRDSVKRTFVLDSQTVVEGKLKEKARVAVRYSSDENGQLHAIHIIVR